MRPALEQDQVTPAQAAEEAAATQAMINRLRGMMLDFRKSQSLRGEAASMHRAVHIKMHGLMRAEFSVAADLPEELRVGLFATPATYPAWVRFSNSANGIQPDGTRDIRGVGIKLMGVPGRKLAPGEEDASTHDFILISAPIFPSKNAAQFDALAGAVIGSLWHKLRYFVGHPRVAWMLLNTMKRHANVLQLHWWSCVPYLFGTRAVRYGLIPHVGVPDKLPFDPPENQLRLAAAAQLAKGDATFDFCVQLQSDEQRMPLDEPRVAWSEAVSPMRRVAKLKILQQDFDTDARNALAEQLSFTPWHALPEHQPLGSVNRSRKVMYETLSTFRHQADGTVRREPTGWDA